jgi:hypothetical protein
MRSKDWIVGSRHVASLLDADDVHVITAHRCPACFYTAAYPSFEESRQCVIAAGKLAYLAMIDLFFCA